MTEDRWKTTPTVVPKKDKGEAGVMAVSELSEEYLQIAARLKLRQRWELASVLNFLNVFEPVIESKMNVSAEQIETGLIKPNMTIARLHLKLLEGIPPVSTTLKSHDAWVTALCKKLATWWPWFAEGNIPLTAAKGEEISRYKELDPTIRLLLLKALCEIRADQHDIVFYINDALKNGAHISAFRKEKIGVDGNAVAYWYDGNAISGYRLYKEVNEFGPKQKVNGKEIMFTSNSQWSTLATNLEEFRKVVDDFTSGELKVEAAVAKTVETDVIPVLEKLLKKKERALKQQARKEKLLNGFQNCGITRFCRNRRPVCYTFDEYDRAIDEAIREPKKRKITDGQKSQEIHGECGESIDVALNEVSNPNANLIEGESSKSESAGDRVEGGNAADDSSDDDYDAKTENDGNEEGTESDNSDKENIDHLKMNHAFFGSRQPDSFARKPRGLRYSNRLAGIAGHSVLECTSLGTKNRLRQRPTRNTVLVSVVPDSEDEHSVENKTVG